MIMTDGADNFSANDGEAEVVDQPWFCANGDEIDGGLCEPIGRCMVNTFPFAVGQGSKVTGVCCGTEAKLEVGHVRGLSYV